MYIFSFSIVFTFFLLNLGNVLSQDKILLLNGKRYDGQFLSKSEDLVNFNFEKKNGKIKPFSFEINRVYSITKQGENESVLYRIDTTIYNYFSKDEMRMFIYGEEDAYNRFKVKKTFAVGFAVGLGVSMYDTYLSDGYTCNDGTNISGGFFKRQPSLAQLIIPFITPIITGAIKPKMKVKHASDPTYLMNQQYIDGFKKVRRFKRIKSSLLGTLTGVAIGMIGYYITPTPCQ